jgi:hypothetical protein
MLRRLGVEVSFLSGLPCGAVSCDAKKSDSWDAGAHGGRPALAVGRVVGRGGDAAALFGLV